MAKILVLGFGLAAAVAFSQIFSLMAAAMALTPDTDMPQGVRVVMYGKNGWALLTALGLIGGASVIACALLAKAAFLTAKQ